MKDYALYARSSISMSNDELFLKTIDNIFTKYPIKTIIESGTFKGTGSTTTLAKAIIKNRALIDNFYTIEVDHNFYKVAKKWLKKYKFVHPIWGLSVDESEAISFIENDEAINNHTKYPDIYIDTLTNPKDFYLNEIKGQLSKTAKKSFIDSLFSFKSNNDFFKTNVFASLLPKVTDQIPLILLDSAGGIGFLEFNTVLKYLHNSEFIIILDDIHHLKHFRSLQYIKSSNNFQIIAENVIDGWVVARHKQTVHI